MSTIFTSFSDSVMPLIPSQINELFFIYSGYQGLVPDLLLL